MKKLLLVIFVNLNILYSFSQNCDISLMPVVDVTASTNYYPQVENYLKNKLKSLTLSSGNISAIENNQFAIVLNYDILDKFILSGAPTKIVYNIAVNLFIVDLSAEKIYSSFNAELRGSGDTEIKALINCFKSLDFRNYEIKNFIEIAKRAIFEYYDNNYQRIITKAMSEAAMKNFEAAIYTILCIPECCIGYEIALNQLVSIYNQFVNQHCNENLAQARAAWYASPNSDGAAIAGVYLSEIYPEADCYKEALELFNEIKNQIGKEWNFIMKQYFDSVTIEQQRMEMMREIAITYVMNQPKDEINIFWNY